MVKQIELLKIIYKGDYCSWSAISVYCDIDYCFHDQTEFFWGIHHKLPHKDRPNNKKRQHANIYLVALLAETWHNKTSKWLFVFYFEVVIYMILVKKNNPVADYWQSRNLIGYAGDFYYNTKVILLKAYGMIHVVTSGNFMY